MGGPALPQRLDPVGRIQGPAAGLARLMETHASVMDRSSLRRFSRLMGRTRGRGRVPAHGAVQVVPLTRQRADLLRFIRVADRVYRDDPYWVAPLRSDLLQVLSDANPLFAHAQMQLWVARRDGADVGRVAALEDRLHNTRHREQTAFFGFFECINDPQVCAALFEAVCAWARARRLGRLLGPMNPTNNEVCGLLVHGFNDPPVIMMPYNPPYYLELLAGVGFRKAKDLLAFHIDLAQCPMARLARIKAKVAARWPELRCRPVRRRTLAQDLALVQQVYNSAWEDNWGFVPMTPEGVRFFASRVKPLFREGLVWLAEAGSEPVGFLLGVPDLNLALQPLRGRLLSPWLVRALPYLMGWKVPRRGRVVALGVTKPFRGRGLESVMLYEALKIGLAAGYREAEASWVLEDNVLMCRVLEAFGGKPYKTYRLLEREI